MRRFCTQCGSALEEGARFCSSCGCKIEYKEQNINDNNVNDNNVNDNNVNANNTNTNTANVMENQYSGMDNTNNNGFTFNTFATNEQSQDNVVIHEPQQFNQSQPVFGQPESQQNDQEYNIEDSDSITDDTKSKDTTEAQSDVVSLEKSESQIQPEDQAFAFGNTSQSDNQTSVFGNTSQFDNVSPQFGSTSQFDNVSPQFGSTSQFDNVSPQFGSTSQFDNVSPQFGSTPQFDNQAPQFDNNTQFGNQASQFDNNTQFGNQAPQFDNNVQFGNSAPQFDNNAQFGNQTSQFDNNAQFGNQTSQFDNNTQFGNPAPQLDNNTQFGGQPQQQSQFDNSNTTDTAKKSKKKKTKEAKKQAKAAKQQAKAAKQQNDAPKKKGKGGVIAAVVVILALVAALVILLVKLFTDGGFDINSITGIFGGTSGYEKPFQHICTAIEEDDASKLEDAYLPSTWDVYGVTSEDLLEALKDAFLDCGEVKDVTYKVRKSEELKDSDLDEVKDYIDTYYEEDGTIKSAYDVTVKITVKGSDDKETTTDEYVVVKVNGKWYITTMTR